MRGGLAALAAAAALGAAKHAWACPSCIGQNETLPPALKLVGLFLLLPFALFGIGVVVARRLARHETQVSER